MAAGVDRPKGEQGGGEERQARPGQALRNQFSTQAQQQG
jgi:hypothetical protein